MRIIIQRRRMPTVYGCVINNCFKICSYKKLIYVIILVFIRNEQ